MFNREARTAGRNPPTTPMIIEKINDLNMIPGESANPNANSENVPQFMV
jgi:hypothetical protein